MNALFWQRFHGGSTHFPIVLLMMSVVFDFAGWRWRDESLKRGLQLAGLGSAVVGVLGGVGAVISGLVLSRGQVLGSGYERFHHLFVWPAFGISVALVAWRVLKRGGVFGRVPVIYITGMALASGLMMGAGYWGGEMLLGAETQSSPATAGDGNSITAGRELYLLNCAHCHGPDATGDEGPDLHGLKKSNERIASVIKNGIKGEMPKFDAKLADTETQSLIAYIRSLK